jgi:hypothetical protein
MGNNVSGNYELFVRKTSRLLVCDSGGDVVRHTVAGAFEKMTTI